MENQSLLYHYTADGRDSYEKYLLLVRSRAYTIMRQRIKQALREYNGTVEYTTILLAREEANK